MKASWISAGLLCLLSAPGIAQTPAAVQRMFFVAMPEFFCYGPSRPCAPYFSIVYDDLNADGSFELGELVSFEARAWSSGTGGGFQSFAAEKLLVVPDLPGLTLAGGEPDEGCLQGWCMHGLRTYPLGYPPHPYNASFPTHFYRYAEMTYVPEPSSAALILVGSLAVGLAVRRTRARALNRGGGSASRPGPGPAGTWRRFLAREWRQWAG